MKIFVFADHCYDDVTSEFDTEDEACKWISDFLKQSQDNSIYKIIRGTELKIEPKEIVKTIQLVEK